jgi:hypothetical protein
MNDISVKKKINKLIGTVRKKKVQNTRLEIGYINIYMLMSDQKFADKGKNQQKILEERLYKPIK